MQVRFIISLFIALFVAVFTIKNAGLVDVNLFFKDVKLSQAIVIFISIALGATIVSLLGINSIWKLKKTNKELQKKLTQTQDENTVLIARLREKQLDLGSQLKNEGDKDEFKG